MAGPHHDRARPSPCLTIAGPDDGAPNHGRESPWTGQPTEGQAYPPTRGGSSPCRGQPMVSPDPGQAAARPESETLAHGTPDNAKFTIWPEKTTEIPDHGQHCPSQGQGKAGTANCRVSPWPEQPIGRASPWLRQSMAGLDHGLSSLCSCQGLARPLTGKVVDWLGRRQARPWAGPAMVLTGLGLARERAGLAMVWPAHAMARQWADPVMLRPGLGHVQRGLYS
jgi:hypothetical protein